jgi:hypothetical protein
MDGSVPNLRRHLAGLFAGVIDLSEFQRWFWENYDAIEQQGSNEDVDLLLLVLNRLAEHTGDYIDAAELLEALRADPLVQKEFRTRQIAVA